MPKNGTCQHIYLKTAITFDDGDEARLLAGGVLANAVKSLSRQFFTAHLERWVTIIRAMLSYRAIPRYRGVGQSRQIRRLYGVPNSFSRGSSENHELLRARMDLRLSVFLLAIILVARCDSSARNATVNSSTFKADNATSGPTRSICAVCSCTGSVAI